MSINEAIGCALSKSLIKPATWADICRVAKAMKPDHRRTACALADTSEPLEAIRGLEYSPFVGVTIWRDGEPIAACGAVLEPQNAASTFLFATDIRQIKAQLDATEALKAAAKAEETAANASVEGVKAARVNSYYMLASVIVAFVAAAASAFSAYFAYLSAIHSK